MANAIDQGESCPTHDMGARTHLYISHVAFDGHHFLSGSGVVGARGGGIKR